MRGYNTGGKGRTMGMMTGIIRTVDSRGRLSLGADFAFKGGDLFRVRHVPIKK